MQTSPCECGNRLFFRSNTCLRCGHATGLCPECRNVVPLLTSDGETLTCGNSDCGATLKRCENGVKFDFCNCCYVPDAEIDSTQCHYCRLTTVIPDLKIEGNLKKWARLELAKKRALYIVEDLGLAFSYPERSDLTFEFKSDGKKSVHTGHDNGCITINIKEADTVERERSRVSFGEHQRTLVGHFRHELGHYYWDCLVQGKCEDEYRKVFGDERNPDYATALKTYYENGPATNWQDRYISGYATMHSWEDFAETFNACLDMATVLHTSEHFLKTKLESANFDEMLKNYQMVGLYVNELNRDMGLLDLVPEVFVDPVIEKLRFVYELIEGKPQVN